MFDVFIFLFIQQMDLTKLNKSVKKSNRKNLEKQKNFNNRYSRTETIQSYDSFTDPHCSYYFSSPSVMSNLKHLKKAIANQRKSSENKKLELLIRQRDQISMKLSSIFKRRSHVSKSQEANAKQFLRQTLGSISFFNQTKKEQDLLDSSRNKSAFKTSNIGMVTSNNKQFMGQSCSNNNFHGKLSLNPEKITNKMKKTMSNQQDYSNRLAQTLHHKKRIKWMSYLEQRKNALLHKKSQQSVDQKQLL